MNKTEKILGIGSLFTFISLILMYFFSFIIYEAIGFGVLIIPVLGLLTTFWSLFYVYRNKRYKIIDEIWIVILFVIPFIFLPFFWYNKIYLGRNNAT